MKKIKNQDRAPDDFGYIRIRGLPFSCRNDDLIKFFNGG